MRNAVRINLADGTIQLNDNNKKTLDNYILELEDRLIDIYDILEEYKDVDPNKDYVVSGEKLFEIMDILEDRK